MLKIVSLYQRITYCNICDFAVLLQNEQKLLYGNNNTTDKNNNDILNLMKIQHSIHACKLLNAELQLKPTCFAFFGFEITKGRMYGLIISWGCVRVATYFIFHA